MAWLDWSGRLAQQTPESAPAVLAEMYADTTLSDYDRRQILALALYEATQHEKRSKRQRRAMALLRSFLSPPQLLELRRRRCFRVRGSLGNWYELWPATGVIWRLGQVGRRVRGVARYCLHDYAEDDPTFVSVVPEDGKRSLLPPADRTLAHLLLLSADEAEFRRLANESIWRDWTIQGAGWGLRLRAERRALGLDEAA